MSVAQSNIGDMENSKQYEVYNVHTGEAASRPYAERTQASAVATDSNAGSGGWNYAVRDVA